jgi:hypothetical protein
MRRIPKRKRKKSRIVIESKSHAYSNINPISIGEIMGDSFGVTSLQDLWDYSRAKTPVMFCNGMWCG